MACAAVPHFSHLVAASRCFLRFLIRIDLHLMTSLQWWAPVNSGACMSSYTYSITEKTGTREKHSYFTTVAIKLFITSHTGVDTVRCL